MNKLPRILLVGAGRFGKKHLLTLKSMHDEGVIDFVGAVVRTDQNRKLIEDEFKIVTFPKLTKNLLKSVEAVDIVTPVETHFNLVKMCLTYTNVMVEKPLAETSVKALKLQHIAQKQGRILAVGHVFRYHRVTDKLKELSQELGTPRKIQGSFINPKSSDQGRPPALELLHLFDIVDSLWAMNPSVVSSRRDGRVLGVDIRYKKECDARFDLGWRGEEKERFLIFSYQNCKIKGDFISGMVSIHKDAKTVWYDCSGDKDPLRLEIESFVSKVRGDASAHIIDARVAARIIAIAEKADMQKTKSPRIAVIGGGIFGTNAAIELSALGTVTLFEKNHDILTEGSFVNQFRHHRGYHYPRSDATVEDIKRSRADFELFFKDAIDHKIPTYYGVAKEGSLVSAKEFMEFCKKHKLPYKKAFPKAELLARNLISFSVKVPELNYHHGRLKAKVKDKLKEVNLLCNTTVLNCEMLEDGTKVITYQTAEKVPQTKEFDIVVNATYANINRFAHWLDFENCSIRVDLAEVLIVKLPVEPFSITVIDGPFATLMPTGNPNEFTLYHVRESILERYVPQDGLIKRYENINSKKESIFRESLKLFPILKDATIVESRIVHRGVQAYHEHDDSRVADLIDHGFGCWSILSGKILSSVTISKKLSKIISADIDISKKSIWKSFF